MPPARALERNIAANRHTPMNDIDSPQAVFNLRDIGGLQAAHGRRVRERLIYRSEAPSTLAEERLAALHALGIRVVCDLRSREERRHAAIHWHPDHEPETLLMDVNSDLRAARMDIVEVLRRDPTVRGARAMMRMLYEEMPRALLPHLRTIFERLIEGGATPMMVHCTAGKDRTGVCCALILLALGVAWEDVLSDYMATERFSRLPAFQAKVAKAIELSTGGVPAPEVVQAIAGVRASYLVSAIDAVKAVYGSVDAYLQLASLDARRTERLRERLLC